MHGVHFKREFVLILWVRQKVSAYISCSEVINNHPYIPADQPAVALDHPAF